MRDRVERRRETRPSRAVKPNGAAARGETEWNGGEDKTEWNGSEDKVEWNGSEDKTEWSGGARGGKREEREQ